MLRPASDRRRLIGARVRRPGDTCVLDRMPGFSLMEVVLVVIIIAVLAALSMGLLSRSRGRALEMTTLSNLRSHATIFAMYTSDWRDSYPCPPEPEGSTYRLAVNGSHVTFDRYFEFGSLWHVALADQYYAGNYRSAVFTCPEDEYPNHLGFEYASCLYSRPEFWHWETREGPHQWKPVLSGDVLHPDRKGVLFTNRMWHGLGNSYPPLLGNEFRIGFADASAGSFRIEDVASAYVRGEGNWPGSVRKYAIQVHHTINGVRGADAR